ncbi:hypothetical protein B0A55_08033 [Friedmanniomyces simplex]|uniref:UBC core domain-containing protein n=1 Tax=Friedmanniomyces simplex TaxID=329884 RepID=A0A4U0X7D3_9PEZI|nr:hypothetical protein B0A55_08033 [Friedmanniomyces simplex]
MTALPPGFVYQKLCLDFTAVKHACPKGIYVAPVPDEPLQWTGVLFPRKGPYATAVLRFQIDFTADYPARPPIIKFLCDVFHPLVTPLTTYTHTTRDLGADTMSSADEDRLPPGGLTLRHGFPEWHDERVTPRDRTTSLGPATGGGQSADGEDGAETSANPPFSHIIQVLQYLRIIFDSAELLDSVPFEYAANTSAWHAWRSYRANMAPVARSPPEAGEASSTITSRQPQPGGARQPGQWNWQGVWQDRVRKSIQASKSDHALFSADDDGVINFQQWETEAVTPPATEPDQSSLLVELESMVGTLETEVLHVEARYRSSLLPYSNVITVRHIVEIRRPKTESRWSIIGTYSDMETSEQMYTKLAIYLADSYPPDKALKYIDRYLAKEAEQEPVRQIRRRVADETAVQQAVSADFGDKVSSERKPTVVVTDIDIASTMESANSAEEYATAPCTPSADPEPLGMHDGNLAAIAPRVKSRSTSLYAIRPYEPPPLAALSPSKSTVSIATPCTATNADAADDARRLWQHIRRSSLSPQQLVEMAPERLQNLEAGDEALRELRRRALANKRSVGAETLKGWKWDCGQVVKLGEAPWL